MAYIRLQILHQRIFWTPLAQFLSQTPQNTSLIKQDLLRNTLTQKGLIGARGEGEKIENVKKMKNV